MKLPDLPDTERGIRLMADREGWRAPAREYPAAPDGVWRRREGRGGGYEYRYDVLPTNAKRKLMLAQRRDLAKDVRAEAKAGLARDARWDWFEALPEVRREKARERLAVLNAVHDLVMAGRARDVAMMHAAAEAKVSLRTLYSWAEMVAGVAKADWLPYLMPRHAGRQAEADCSPEAWEWFKANYLRQAEPSVAHCYRQLQAVARAQGWTIPSQKTLARRIAALDETTRVFLRKGPEALKRMYPAQERDRSALHALEAVNADGHKWDVFVKFPDGEVTRPCLVGFQDIYSGLILSWRVDKTENKAAVRLAFGDLVETYGIPDHVIFDNGRNFASKWITGGAPTRFRFKVKDDEPAGVVIDLGCQLHWATPYHGQAKPIERAWRDFAGNIARDVRFEGAWTGNSIANKPENYGNRAVPLDLFLQVVSEGVVEHNTRLGRQSKTCNGDSFTNVFATSYQSSPIRQASPMQRLKWLLPAEAITARKPDGALILAGNRYWAEFLLNHIGRKLVLRVDPQALQQDAHVYELNGSYLGKAPCIEAAGFFDTDAARAHARARTEFLRAAKAMATAERKMTLDQVAELMPRIETPELPETRIVRPYFGNAAVALQPANEFEAEASEDSFFHQFNQKAARFRVVRNEDGAGD
nr:transposase domain-containing protein [Ancylobacter defluvii]